MISLSLHSVYSKTKPGTKYLLYYSNIVLSLEYERCLHWNDQISRHDMLRAPTRNRAMNNQYRVFLVLSAFTDKSILVEGTLQG